MQLAGYLIVKYRKDHRGSYFATILVFLKAYRWIHQHSSGVGQYDGLGPVYCAPRSAPSVFIIIIFLQLQGRIQDFGKGRGVAAIKY